MVIKYFPLEAVVQSVSGTVSVKPREKPERPLAQGDNLRTGDLVKAGHDSLAILRIGRKNLVRVEAESELLLRAMLNWPKSREQDSFLEVVKGRIAAIVEKLTGRSTFNVRAPSAVAAVRGTDFRTKAEGGASFVEVLGGNVAARSPAGTVAVPAGFGSRIESGTAPMPPRKLPPPPVPAVVKDETVLDRGLGAQVTWSAAKGTAAYRIQVARDPFFGQLARERMTDDTSLLVKDLEPGVYYFRIASRDAIGLEGAFCERRELDVLESL